MSYSALSDSFEYLCYGSTAIRNISTLYSAGVDFRRQHLTTKVYPRAVRVNGQRHNETCPRTILISLEVA